MKKTLAAQKIWAAAIKASADPDRTRARLNLLSENDPSVGASLEQATPEEARILAAVFSGSAALGAMLCSRPQWTSTLRPVLLEHPRRKDGLARDVETWLGPALKVADYAGALAKLREFKEKQTLRIAARDLARLSSVPDITRELSDLADVSLETVWRVVMAQLTARHGTPWHQDAEGSWQQTQACVFGMGKLGGQELNYSSDVDVIFAYDEEGGVFQAAPEKKNPRPVLTNHQFFNRVAESFISEVSRTAAEGTLYRIDLRLRPEGDSGPLTRSLSSYENYYAQWGQTWERMMLIKTRRVAGSNTTAGEFLEMIQPFRYPRSINPSVLHEVAAMKDRIETDVVKSGELDRNVKLGRGGIREIEFIVQSRQLLHAGRQPFLQSAQTLPALQKLVAYELMDAAEAGTLDRAYCFLRDVEHRVQMEDNQQTHTIPSATPALTRLSKLMGFSTLKEFESALSTHTRFVRATFERLLHANSPEAQSQSAFPDRFDGQESRWKEVLVQHRFRDVDKALRVLREFVEGPGYVHVSERTSNLAHQLLPRLFAMCPKQGAASKEQPKQPRSNRKDGTQDALPLPDQRQKAEQPPLSDPDRVLTRLDSFIAAYGARSTLFEFWHSNPAVFDLLVLLFDRSEFLAELAIRTPDLVDELVTGDRLRLRKTTTETLKDLRHGIEDPDQHLWMRRYHQAELMRIGLRDILGLADPAQYLDELSSLADACLSYALEVIARKHRLKKPPFAIIGMGKLGGREIDYGSDLDILFVAGHRVKNLSMLSKMAVEIMDLLSRRTELGIIFQTDARLRPDGEKGLLVNTVAAYEDYYRERALIWEIQALTRSRAIVGDPEAAEAFDRLSGRLTNFSQPALPMSAYNPEWKATIRKMRLRIEKERTPGGKDALAIKTGVGGLIDAEFVAQALCLEHGWREPNTLSALQKGADAGALQEAAALIQGYRFIRQVERILRRWSYEGETVLPDQPEPYYRVSVRCGFASPEEFGTALAQARTAVRAGFTRYFSVKG